MFSFFRNGRPQHAHQDFDLINIFYKTTSFLVIGRDDEHLGRGGRGDEHLDRGGRGDEHLGRGGRGNEHLS